MRPRPLVATIGGILATAAFAAAAQPPGAPPTATPTPVQLVDALNGTFGRHAGVRASHAKGVCTVGDFVGLPAARELTSAAIFDGRTWPVTARFSVGGGNPKTSDKSRSVRGLAFRIGEASGAHADLVLISAPVFFVNSPANFVAFLESRRPDPATGRPDPARIQAFLASHPDAQPQADFLARTPPPASFASTPYFGVNAFRFTNAQGETVHARWRFEPAAGRAGLTEEQLKTHPDEFLAGELGGRLGGAPVRFDAYLQVAEAGDVVDDPTVEWPATRREVRVGELTIRQTGGDACQPLLFNPLSLVAGIAPSDDPTLLARPASYAVSLGRRLQ